MSVGKSVLGPDVFSLKLLVGLEHWLLLHVWLAIDGTHR